MNYSGILHNDMCNGEGVRVTLFVSGCKNNCKGCHNPETHDYNYGQEFDVAAKMAIENDLKTNLCDGLTLTGGDPLDGKNCNDTFYWWLKSLKKNYPDKTIWCYTGMMWETLCDHDCIWDTVRECIDVLVDGRYIEELADRRLLFRGSSNQRIIDVKKTLENNKVTLWTPITRGEKALGHKLSIADPIIQMTREYVKDIIDILDEVVVLSTVNKATNTNLQDTIEMNLSSIYRDLIDIKRELSMLHYDVRDINELKKNLDSLVVTRLISSLLINIPMSGTARHDIEIMLRSKLIKFNAQYSRHYSVLF